MPHDPLNRCQRNPFLEKQSDRRVPRVVKSDVSRQRLCPKEHVALRTSTAFRVRILLFITTTLSTALVQIARDDSGSPHRSSENDVECQVARVHGTICPRKNQVGS